MRPSEPYRSPDASVVPAKYRLDPKNRVTSVDHGDVCINTDKRWFAVRIVPYRTLDNVIDVNAYPAADADIRWPIKFPWRFLDQSFLDADCGRQRYRDMSVTVMIV